MKRRPVLADQVVEPRVRPQLRVVRSSDPPPPLELPSSPRLIDSPAVGASIAASFIFAAVLIALAMGWLTF